MKYLKYFKYVMVHKKNVFKVCLKKKMWIHAITHDMSKFRPIEFISYTKKFFGDSEDAKNSGFGYGWLHHQRKNKHHWDYWVKGDGVAVPMPKKYILQMICDWTAMGMALSDTPLSFYKRRKRSINLHPITRSFLEHELGFIEEVLPKKLETLPRKHGLMDKEGKKKTRKKTATKKSYKKTSTSKKRAPKTTKAVTPTKKKTASKKKAKK